MFYNNNYLNLLIFVIIKLIYLSYNLIYLPYLFNMYAIEKIEAIEKKIDAIFELLVKLNNNIEIMDKKINKLSNNINDNLVPECKKMGSHIDFVENVYDTVKYPLGYLCNKIKALTEVNTPQHTLTNT